MDFYKYQAAGNDFVLVTSMAGRTDIAADEVIRLCDRRYGIGADGLIILEGSRDYDFAMRFFNNDGSGRHDVRQRRPLHSGSGRAHRHTGLGKGRQLGL